jgi:dephospho-CoA kinase
VFLIGLTGGIAAGKSAVAEHWVKLGAIEIDADLLAREVVAKGTPGAKQVEQTFGSDFFVDGELDRKKLGQLVFSQPERLATLEAIVHPLVKQRARDLIAAVPESAIVIYTVPLLVEAQVELPFDAVVTIEAPEDERIKRLVKSRGMTEAEALSRIRAQATPLERATRADHILSSNQSLALLLHDSEVLFQKFVVANEAKQQ